MRTILLTLALAATMTACSLGVPRDTGNANRVALDPITPPGTCTGHGGGTLTVAYPQVPDALNTYRIALTDFDQRADYFAGMRWEDFLPDTIQAALVESLRRTGRYDAVRADRSVAVSRWRLESDVREFEAVYQYADGTPEVHIEMAFRLRRSGSGDAGRSLVVSKAKAAAGKNAAAIAQAFRDDFLSVQQEAIRRLFCREKL
jgi:cholesterol transport system auxiliary component